MSQRSSASLALSLLLVGGSWGCMGTDGGPGTSDNGLTADHPYGEIFVLSGDEACTETTCAGADLFSKRGYGTFVGSGHCGDDFVYERLIGNCGDQPSQGAFVLAFYDGDPAAGGEEEVRSSPVEESVPPGSGVWMQILIPAEQWPRWDGVSLPNFEGRLVIDPDDGVDECNQENNEGMGGLDVGWRC